MGIYLYSANFLFDNHIEDASASLAFPDYKNFLRMHLTPDGLIIYPIGIDRVTKNWKESIKDGRRSFSGDEVKYDLIEDPVIIPHQK